MASPQSLCNFLGVYGKPCAGEVVKLSQCNDDISRHLSYLKIGGGNNLTEEKLIISRAVCLQLQKDQPEAEPSTSANIKCSTGLSEDVNIDSSTTMICKTHRLELGMHWRRFRRTCEYPGHEGAAKPNRHLNYEMHCQMRMMSPSDVLPVGAHICPRCRTHHAEMHEAFLLQESDDTDVPGTQSSQASSYQSWRGMSVSMDEINHALAVLCQACDLQTLKLDSRLSSEWSSVSKAQQSHYKSLGTQLISMVGEVLAPGQGKMILKDIIKDHEPDQENDPHKCPLLDNMIQLYSASQSWQEKRKLLSVFCQLYSKDTLLQLVPDLTVYAIDSARKHASDLGIGSTVPESNIIRNRLSEEQVDHFLDYISDPVYMKTASYGSKEVILSTGEAVELPQVMRPIMKCHLIDNYLCYCEEFHFQPLPRASLFRVLQDCEATYSTNLQGLDNISAQGGEGFTLVELVARQLQMQGQTVEWHKEVINKVGYLKDYLKFEYRSHISLFDDCPSHCIAFALSDPSDAAYQIQCNHTHARSCDACDTLQELREVLIQAVQKCKDDETRRELEHDLHTAFQHIEEYQAHILRCVNQDRCRLELLSSLENHQVLLVMDWAMKFLPAYYREKQQDFFGKRGKSWHVSVVIYRDPSHELKMRTFVHIFEQVKQDWQAVVAVIQNTFLQIKIHLPQVKEVFLRSDNAGCYKSAGLLSSLLQVEKSTGLTLKRYDFSEAQDGKDVCDRKIGPLRQRIRRYVREGHDVTNATEMKLALDQDGGVKGVQTAIVELTTTSAQASKWQGIQSLMNFSYNSSDGTVTTWKAYGIGPGKVRSCDVDIVLPYLTFSEEFSAPKQSEGDLISKRAKTDQQPSCDTLPSFSLSCPEPGCNYISVTHKELEEHATTGQHIVSSHDLVTLKWKKKLESVTADMKTSRMPSTTSTFLTTTSAQGWAMRTSKRTKHHSQAVKQHLTTLFEKGQQTGKKADPAAVAQDLKTARTAEGRKAFHPDDWLSPQQIASFFSRLAARSKSTSVIDETDEEAAVDLHDRAQLKNSLFSSD